MEIGRLLQGDNYSLKSENFGRPECFNLLSSGQTLMPSSIDGMYVIVTGIGNFCIFLHTIHIFAPRPCLRGSDLGKSDRATLILLSSLQGMELVFSFNFLLSRKLVMTANTSVQNASS